MDIVEFQEKMDPTHRASLCRMLKMKRLPESLLKQYARAKLLVDRIDGHLYVGDLALIALGAGFNPDTGKFCVTEREVLQAQPVEAEQLVDEPVEQQVEVEQRGEGYASGKELTDVDEAQTVEQPQEATIEQPVSGATGQAQEQPTEQPQTSSENGKHWAPGMPVSVLHNEELKQGNIVGIYPPVFDDSRKVTQLTVDFGDGETLTVNEDEVDAL